MRTSEPVVPQAPHPTGFTHRGGRAALRRFAVLAGFAAGFAVTTIADAQSGAQPSSSSTQKILDGFIQSCNYEAIPNAWETALPADRYGALRLQNVSFDAEGDQVLTIDVTLNGVMGPADQTHWGALWGVVPRPGAPPLFPPRTFTHITPSKAKEKAAMRVSSTGRELTVTCTITRGAPAATPATSSPAPETSDRRSPCANTPFFFGRFGSDEYAICPEYENGSGGPELVAFALSSGPPGSARAMRHRADESPSSVPFNLSSDGIYHYVWFQKNLQTTLFVDCVDTRVCDKSATRLIRFVGTKQVSTTTCVDPAVLGQLPNGDPVNPCHLGMDRDVFGEEASVLSERKRRPLMVYRTALPKMLENAANRE